MYGKGACLRHALTLWILSYLLQRRYNGYDGVSNHQPHHCLPNRFFWRILTKTSKVRVTGLCAVNSPVTGEFPAQMASNAENVSISWRHHVNPESWHLMCWIDGNTEEIRKKYFQHLQHWHGASNCIRQEPALVARFMTPTWGPSGSDRTQVGPMLATWTLLSGRITAQLIVWLLISSWCNEPRHQQPCYWRIYSTVLIFQHPMMTSSNGNIFRVTGHLCGEFTGFRWIPLTKASDAEL